MVSRLCEELGLPHASLAIEVPPGNVQGNARTARYAALARWAGERALDALATGHHADDQAETLLMRLNRGSGLAGLAGVRPIASLYGMTVLRPLLGWRRAELDAICAAEGVAPVSDPSNLDKRFDRARVRANMASAEWIDPLALAASAANLRDADEALKWIVDREWKECVEARGGSYRYSPAAPTAVRLRVLGRVIEALGGRPRGGQLAQLEAALSAGTSGNLAGVLARCEGGAWTLGREPARRT